MYLRVLYIILVFLVCQYPFETYATDINTGPISKLKQLEQPAINDSERVSLLFEIASEYMKFSPDSTIIYGVRGVELAQKGGLVKLEAMLRDKVSTAYSRIGNYPAAMEQTLESMRISEKAEDTRLMAMNYETLGTLFTDLQNNTLGMVYYEKALQLSEKFGYDDITAWLYNDMAQFYADHGKLEQAIEYYDKMKPFPVKLNDEYMDALMHLNLGAIYSQKEEYEKSMDYLGKSLELSRKINDLRLVSANLTVMANILFKTGKPDQGVAYCLEALEVAQQVKNHQFISASSGNLYHYYNERNDYKNALKYLQIKQSVADKTFSREQITAFDNLIYKYEMAIKEQAISSLNNEKKIKRIELTFAISGLLLILGALFLAVKSRQRMKKINAELSQKNHEIVNQADLLSKAKMEMEEKVVQRTKDLEEEKRKSLQAILIGQESERERISKDLHDSLSIRLIGIKRSIESYEKDKNAKILEDIDQVIGQVREISHNLNPYSLKNMGLVKAVEDLCYSVRNQHPINVAFSKVNMDEVARLNPLDETELFRVVQEVFTNIIKHSEASEVYVEIIGDENQVMLTVEDNGKGFDIQKLDNGGIGINNIYARVALLGGSVNYDTAPGKGTTVFINLPTKRNHD
jgi:signal transduction histidine kinase